MNHVCHVYIHDPRKPPFSERLRNAPAAQVTFVMIHPGVRGSRGNLHEPPSDPKIPLLWYQSLELQLKRLADNQTVRRETPQQW